MAVYQLDKWFKKIEENPELIYIDDTPMEWTDEELEEELHSAAKERGFSYEEYIAALDNGIIGEVEQQKFVAELRKNNNTKAL